MKILLSDEDINSAYKAYHHFTEDKQLRMLYEARMRFKRDVADGMEEAEERGLEQGLKQGLEQGTEQNKIEIAKKLFKKGMDTSEIADITGLGEKKIKELLQKY